MRRLALLALAAAAAGAFGLLTVGTAGATTPPKPLPRVTIYVESQGLCYDSIVTAQDLPDQGPFQTLEADPGDHCGVGGDALKTEFGPGDVGYIGGRWELTMPDGSIVHFMCPLLGPGTQPPA